MNWFQTGFCSLAQFCRGISLHGEKADCTQAGIGGNRITANRANDVKLKADVIRRSIAIVGSDSIDRGGK
jgi:hypothetical protein